MYSDSDLDSAVTAGALTAEQATQFRAHMAAIRATPLVDEENFRLITGFNDIFVAVAGVLLLFGAGWLGAHVQQALGGLAVAGAAWGLSEYFTRVRCMALPSILFLLAFVGGVFTTASGLLMPDGYEGNDRLVATLIAASAATAALAAWFHWRRFQVPITVAAGVAAASGVLLALFFAAFPVIETVIYLLLLALGLVVFAIAMRWDMADPQRRTRKSDVAFWLHLLAAPMMAHPIFAMLGLLEGGSNAGEALLVVLLYLAMGCVALAVDRRALLVSALGYVLFAIGTLFREFGAISVNFALTALVIGSALLLLSAFWQNARALVVGWLPGGLAAKLPPVVVPGRLTTAA